MIASSWAEHVQRFAAGVLAFTLLLGFIAACEKGWVTTAARVLDWLFILAVCCALTYMTGWFFAEVFAAVWLLVWPA